MSEGTNPLMKQAPTCCQAPTWTLMRLRPLGLWPYLSKAPTLRLGVPTLRTPILLSNFLVTENAKCTWLPSMRSLYCVVDFNLQGKLHFICPLALLHSIHHCLCHCLLLTEVKESAIVQSLKLKIKIFNASTISVFKTLHNLNFNTAQSKRIH